MYFKRIELNGFKSFADPVSIEFTEGMTCIVGPNGSGKSNISDAIRWVLGEQSPKMLRGGRMEEVIFSGTESRRPKGMAEVTLVIDNSDYTLPIDYSEVAITRRMYRSGESEYMINHNICRLRDIRELIMDTGIAVEGYSIIGQGRIADIIDNKLDSRREIFEEAAGVTKYRIKKEEAEKKLENASGNLERINDIIWEIESRIGGLEAESEKASEYLVLRDKYRDLSINIILRNIEQAESRSETVSLELEELSAETGKAEKNKADIEEAARAARVESTTLEERLNAIRDELIKKADEIHEISGKEELNKERVISFSREKERLEAEARVADEKLERERANADALSEKRKEKEADCARLRSDLELRTAKHGNLSAEFSKVEATLAAKKDRIFELAGNEASIAAEMSGIESLQKTLSFRLEKLSGSTEAAESGDFIVTRLEELEREKETLLSKSAEFKEASAGYGKKGTDLFDKANKLTAKLGSLRVEEGQLAERLRLLEELERSYEGYGGGVKFILKQNIKGIIGILGELLEVPKGYELAVEAVLASRLQNVVCADEDAAKKAIALLKANKAGRLTFLPVDVLRFEKKSPGRKIEESEGYLGLASEMVGCKGGHANVIEYLLGRVIFVDSLDNAVRMSRINNGGWRFVTVEGEVVNASGAITGGSYNNNSASILSRKSEKDEISEKLAENRKNIESVTEAAKKNSRDISSNDKVRQEADAALRKNETELAILSAELESLAGAEKDARFAEERRLSELADLRKEIEEAKKRLAAMGSEKDKLAAEKDDEEKAASLLAAELEAVRLKSSEAGEAESTARIALGEANIRLKASKELEDRILSGIKELEAEKDAREADIRSIELSSKEIEDFGEASADLLREKEDEKKTLEAEAASISLLRRDASEKLEALENQRLEADKRLYDSRFKKHDAELRSARFESQTETLKEKLWEDFEMSYAEALSHASPDFVLSRAVKEAREHRDRMKELGDVNIGAIEEYKATKERYDFITAQRDDVTKAMEELRTLISGMDITIKKRFRESFDLVAANYEAAFSELFNGGHARLTLDDPSDPLTSQIEIEAQPPGKKLQNINLLSGGEKTMAAIALMFAVLKAKPTPFVILDEVEASLDESNIDRFATYLRNFEDTQFALVTHQKATMEYADALYGVTMPEQGITKVLSLKLGDDFEI